MLKCQMLQAKLPFRCWQAVSLWVGGCSAGKWQCQLKSSSKGYWKKGEGREDPAHHPTKLGRFFRELAAGLWSEAGWTKAVLGATNSWVLTSLPLFNDCISAITAFVAAIAASVPLLLLLFSSHSSLKVAQSLCG